MTAATTVRQLFSDGGRRWPKVVLSFDAFEEHCGRVCAGGQAIESVREPADLYLCCACIAGDVEALRSLESEALEVARAAISRINRDRDFVQEALQEVWDKLLLGNHAKILQYSGRGPLKGWIRVAATRVALDRCRSRGIRAAREVELSEQLAAQGANPESFLTKARYGAVFQEAIRRAVSALATQERNVLRMHVSGGCSIDEIGRAYNVHRATAARWLDRSRSRIYESVRQELCAERARLTESEFRSLAHSLGSQLELQLSGYSRSSGVESTHG
jgi:RNA polymerase sigma-70 factor (ECF subfamily)